MLEDQAGLGSFLHEEADLFAPHLEHAMKAIADGRTRLPTERTGASTAGPLVARVELGKDELSLTLNLAALLGGHLKLPQGSPC